MSEGKLTESSEEDEEAKDSIALRTLVSQPVRKLVEGYRKSRDRGNRGQAKPKIHRNLQSMSFGATKGEKGGDGGYAPWNTSDFQKAIAQRKPMVVMHHAPMGDHGLSDGGKRRGGYE